MENSGKGNPETGFKSPPSRGEILLLQIRSTSGLKTDISSCQFATGFSIFSGGCARFGTSDFSKKARRRDGQASVSDEHPHGVATLCAIHFAATGLRSLGISH